MHPRRLELGTLLKDRDDQQPAEWTIRIYNFISILLFLNSDIGIVILYIVKYIRKAFSLPKKINFEVQNLTDIHVFRFAFSDLYCYHTDLQNARNAVSDNLIFKISRGGMPPDPPSKEHLRRSLVRIINWSHPPVKNSGYGPESHGMESSRGSHCVKFPVFT